MISPLPPGEGWGEGGVNVISLDWEHNFLFPTNAKGTVKDRSLHCKFIF